MWREIKYEIIKIFVQKKNYVVVVGHLLLMLLIYIAFRTRKEGILSGSVREMFENVNVYLDGFFFARLAIIPTFMIIMPIFVSTLAGDIVAGEMQDGSLKLYLARPRSRMMLVLSKLAAIYTVTLLYCGYFALVCLLIGGFAFGWPQSAQLIYLQGMEVGNSVSLMSCGDALLRYFGIGLYYSFSLMALGAIVLFLSTIFNRMTAAAISGITLYFVCYIVERLPFAEKIAPYMLSSVMNFPDLFLSPVPVGRLIANLTSIGLYIVFFTMLAMVSMNTKDIK